MTRANYLLIKYIPDLRRQEPVNIGILAWTLNEAILRFDRRSFARVVRESKSLADDALDVMTSDIEHEFAQARIRDDQDVYDFVRDQLRAPFGVADRRNIYLEDTLNSTIGPALANEVEKLLDILVKPVRRRSQDRSPSPKKTLLTGYQRFLDKEELLPDYELVGHQTGVTRKVDFFVNHNTDVAIDVIELQRHATRENAVDTVDGLCRKAEDLLSGGSVKAMIAHLPADLKPGLHDHLQLIRQLMSPIKELQLTTDTNENLEVVRDLVDAHRG